MSSRLSAMKNGFDNQSYIARQRFCHWIGLNVYLLESPGNTGDARLQRRCLPAAHKIVLKPKSSSSISVVSCVAERPVPHATSRYLPA